MMRARSFFKCKSLAILLLLFALQNTYANDTTVTIAAGGIQFKKSNTIQIQREILKIALDKIEISYYFFNTSNQVKHEIVAFPLPLAPVLTGGVPYETTFCETAQHNSKPLVNFKHTIDGKTYGYQCRLQAINAAGHDITAILKKNHIPFSVSHLTGYMEEGELARNPRLKAKLTALHLLDKNGLPIWKTKTTYYWQQTFKPKTLSIATHAYTPAIGNDWLYTNTGQPPKSFADIHFDPNHSGKNLWTNYCLSEQDKNTIVRLFQESKQPIMRVQEVQYILTTGANWNGPIKKFNLQIKPPTPDSLVMFCWVKPVEKTKTGELVSNLANFVPKQDLKILVITPFKPES